jgi:shikimate kinase
MSYSIRSLNENFVTSIPIIVIIGFMGSGKTSVAQTLAAQLGLETTDLDNFITRAVGRTPAQIITQDGEQAFRAIETNALGKLFQTTSAGVIALGGGAWIEETNRSLIDENRCLSIWLDTPFEKCWKRIQSSAESRPLGKTEQQARDLFERRRPVYQLATLHFEVLSDETAAELAARIISKLATS